jgi:hypothetical protein
MSSAANTMTTMVKRLAMSLAVVIGIGLLAGCEAPLPECSDPSVQDLVKQILFDEVAKQSGGRAAQPGWLENVRKVTKIKLSMIRTTGSNERYGKRSCEAELQAQLPNDGGTYGVKYTIQQSDDKKDMLVQMTGHASLVVIIGFGARNLEFSRTTTTGVPASQSAPVPSAPPKPPQQPVAVVPALPSMAVRTVADVTVIWLDCEDLCHLQYKTAQGELKSALCTEAAICRQWAENPPEFNKRIGSHATLQLGSQFVPEGGVTLDSVQELEWKS